MKRKIFRFLIKLLLNAPTRLKEFALIKILNLHSRYEIAQVGVTGRNLVIFAIYPGNSTLQSLALTLDAIGKTNYSVLVVVNRSIKIEKVLNLLKSYKCTVIVRANLGRDLGAYQCGLKFVGLKSLSQNFDNVALINDSLYVTARNKDFYTKFLSSPNWNCIYFNNQEIHHASSHSLIFNSDAINSENLSRFWETYYPSSDRIHSIFNGEFKITEALGESYFKPYVSSELIQRSSSELSLTAIEKSQIRIWSRKSGYQGYDLLIDYLKTNQYSEALQYCIENFQVSNSIGIILYNHFSLFR